MLPSSSHFLPNSLKNLFRVFHYLFPYLVQERVKGVWNRSAAPVSCSLTWNWSLWLTPWHSCPGGDCRGERQGELHGCTMTAGEEREISHVLPLLFTLTHVLSHPGSRAHLGLAEGTGEAGMGTGWQNHVWKQERPFHSCRMAAAPQGTVWAAVTTVSSRTLTSRCKQQCLCPAPVCAQLLSVPSPGPCLAKMGAVSCFRRAMQKAPAAGQPWAKFGCICEVQHKANPTAECVLHCKGKARWENRAEFQSKDKHAGACMAQIPETGGISKVERTIFLCC